MANKEISALIAGAALAGTEKMHVDQSGNSRRTTTAEIATFVQTDKIDKITQWLPVMVFDGSEDVAVGDGAGDIFVPVPSALNGMNLTSTEAGHQTAGAGTGDATIQVRNVTQAADMLSTRMTIDSGEKHSSTAAAATVIDTANDDVAIGDELRIDVDVVPATTAPKGLLVWLGFTAP